MKKIWLILFLLAFLKESIAQPSNSISGKIMDSTTGNSLAYVTVQLLADSNTIIKSTFSDSTGTYMLAAINPGHYFLSFSRAGYTASSSSSFLISDSSQINTGEYFLSPYAKQLSKVTVVSRRPLIEKLADGIVYNAQQDLLAGGGTAIDVLRKTPMVSVAQDGSPAIRGSSNIRVFIDDKPSDLFAPSVADALRQIPAEEIVKVEVILYPSAKYDAEGTDGVINIITRKNKLNGISGTWNLNLGPRNQSSSLSLNIRQQKWIFNIDAGGYLYQNKNSSVFTREEVNKNLLLQQNNWKNKGKTFYSGANIIYVIDSLKSVYAGYRFRTNVNTTDRISLNDYFVSDSILNSFQRNTYNSMGNKVNTINAGYTGKSKNQRHELKSLISYFSHHGYNDYDLEQLRRQSTDYKENFASKTTNAELSIQADYTQKISGIAGLEAGVKATERVSSSTNEFEVYQFSAGKFIADNTRANKFNYNRDVYAGYSNLSLTLKTWQIRLGARYEQTLLEANFRDTSLKIPDYKNFIPSILINRTIGSHSVKLNYNKQILRPFLFYLNPAINYIDSLNLEHGNPYLLPEITHRFELGYSGTFKAFFAGASLFYSRNRNSIENTRAPGDNGVFKSTYQNIGRKEAIGLSGNLSWRKEKITINTNFTLRYMMLKSIALQISNNGFQFNGNMNVSWKFKNGYSAEGLVNINSNDIRLQGHREGWKFYSLVLNKKMNNEKLTISLRAETFNRFITEDFITPAFYQQTKTRYQNLNVLLGLSWKFGKKEIKIPVTQQASND